MLAVTGIYQNGHIILDERVETTKPIKVVITFLEDIASQPPPSKIDIRKFSFQKSKELLKDLKGSLSDAIIEERRAEL
jgi:hypothetical protein